MHKILAYFVMLSRSSLKYVQYVCVDLLCMPSLRVLLHRLVKKPGEKCGLEPEIIISDELTENFAEFIFSYSIPAK